MIWSSQKKKYLIQCKLVSEPTGPPGLSEPAGSTDKFFNISIFIDGRENPVGVYKTICETYSKLSFNFHFNDIMFILLRIEKSHGIIGDCLVIRKSEIIKQATHSKAYGRTGLYGFSSRIDYKELKTDFTTKFNDVCMNINNQLDNFGDLIPFSNFRFSSYV